MMWLEKIKDLWVEHKVKIVVLGCVLFIVSMFLFQRLQTSHDNGTPEINSAYEKQEHKVDNLKAQQQSNTVQKAENNEIIVDIKGAVEHPDIYQMTSNDRLKHLLEKAKPLKDADLSNINLSERLTDQKMFYIPKKGENPTSLSSVQASVNNNGKTVVNLNQADESTLTSVPGIGPQKAKAIIEFRTQNGRFQSVDNLKEIKGIGAKTFEKLKEYFTV